MMSSPEWVAFGNYYRALKDELFWISLRNTLYFLGGGVSLTIIISLIIATLLNQRIPGRNVIRAIYYIPAVISGSAIAVVWRWVFNPDIGILNYLLSLVGIEGPLWLGSTTWAMPALIIMNVSTIGPTVIIFLAGLQAIPNSLYEVADLDGANWWNKLSRITVPLLTPSILFCTVMSVIGSFQIFTPAYVMTKGGPHNATLFYVLYLYNNAFRYFSMGFASSLAWFLFVLILGATLLILKSSSRWVYYGGVR